MDTATHTLTKLDRPYLVVDRRGDTVLLCDLGENKLYSAKLSVKP